MKEGTEKPVSDPSSVLCKQPKSCRKLLAERGLKTKSEADFDKVSSVQEPFAKCFAVHILNFEIFQKFEKKTQKKRTSKC